MKKWMSILVVIVFFCFLLKFKAEGKICNYIVAVINEEIITQTELQRAIETLQAERAISAAPNLDPNQWEKRALQYLIDEKLQLQEARKRGISIYPEEIDQSLAEIRIKNGFANESELEKAITKELER